MNHSRPRLSVAVPLYRSAPFVANIAANIHALGGFDAEVIVSDRHLEDGAAVELRRLFAGDARVRVVEETDRLDWASHYSHLLRRARGEYFTWMPHDDAYANGGLAELVQALDENPPAVLAFGKVRNVTLDGRPLARPRAPDPPHPPPGPWSPVRAGSWLVRWNLGLAFRGVFRRDAAVGRGLYLPSVPGGVQADVAWTFGLALHGPFCFVPGVAIQKRYHPASAQAEWRASPAQIRACGRALRAYLDGRALRRSERLSLALAIRVWMLEQAARLVRRRLPSPRRSGR